MLRMNSLSHVVVAFLVVFSSEVLAAPEKYFCVQQSREMCQQSKGCKRLIDSAPNQWQFVIDLAEKRGKATRCSGGDCSLPFEILVRGFKGEEISAWEPIANEAFAFSPDRRQFTHSLTAARGQGGHVVSEFGYCNRG